MVTLESAGVTVTGKSPQRRGQKGLAARLCYDDGKEQHQQQHRQEWGGEEEPAPVAPVAEEEEAQFYSSIHKRLLSSSSLSASSFASSSLSCWNKKLIGTMISLFLYKEIKRQKKLTSLPRVYLQDTERNRQIQSLMTAVFLRYYRPSLLVGTRSTMNSLLAYARPGPVNQHRVREELKMVRDGATIVLDWELPTTTIATLHNNHGCSDGGSSSSSSTVSLSRDYIMGKYGPISESIVLILHGVNTDTSFGYMRSMMNSCTRNGWIAVGMNARGYGQEVPMTTPRFANAAYTNDLRQVVEVLSRRQQASSSSSSRSSSTGAKLFLVGFSMGANTLVKYLGESGDVFLPRNVAGAISLCNPLQIDHSKLRFPWSHVLAWGGKKQMWKQRSSTNRMTCRHYQNAIQRASSVFRCQRLDDMTACTAPFMIRNSTLYPFENSIGYSSKEEYWKEASSMHYISNVSIPLLVCYANDDGIVKNIPSMMKAYLSNPNIIVVCTPCGGHIGWHCAQHPLNLLGSYNFKSEHEIDKSWADRVVVKFISALMSSSSATSREELHSLSFLDGIEGCRIRSHVAQCAREVLLGCSQGDETVQLDGVHGGGGGLYHARL